MRYIDAEFRSLFPEGITFLKKMFISQAKKKTVTKMLLVLFLIASSGIFQSLPFLLSKVADSHPLFIHQEKNQIQVVLHHTGNRDAHDLKTNKAHHHDLFDQLYAIDGSDETAHTDHKIQIPLFKEKPGTQIDVRTVQPPVLASLMVLSVTPLISGDFFVNQNRISFNHTKRISIPIPSTVLII